MPRLFRIIEWRGLRGVAKAVGGTFVGLLLVGGFVLYYGGIPRPFLPNGTSTSNAAGTSNRGGITTIASASQPTVGDPNRYDCAYPAINTALFCDKLPLGYQIPFRSPNAPDVQCPKGMSVSACSLLKQTMYTGVCTPNETPFTDPFDCGCSGATVADPYLGRCTAPAAICQINANQDNPQP